MSSNQVTIGIDLGTTNSCFGVIKDGKVEIIANDQGKRTTPSFCAFIDSDVIVGDAAKNQAVINAKNTIFDAKRLIGRQYKDPLVQEDIKNWPFKVVNDNGQPKFEVQYQGELKLFSSEKISSLVLKYIKEIAEAHLGTTVTSAVITVPAFFNNAQRKATKVAATMAGLDVLQIINEPTAAAIAYGLDNFEEKKNVLMFDFGGGTLDVTVMSIENGFIDVKSTSGNTHLGGEDFDNRLVAYLAEKFKRKHNKDLFTSKRAFCRLRSACEKAKRTLSFASSTFIVIDSLFEDIDWKTKITKDCFEDVCFDLFVSILEPVKQALKDAALDKREIHEIVLIGGSTRIPKVQKLLQDFFDGKNLNKSINPDEAVAFGATIQAGILSGDTSLVLLQELRLSDVTPLSLGMGVHENDMALVIERNITIPVKKSKEFCTRFDNQTEATFNVYEGDQAKVMDNNFLGRFKITGIPPAPKGAEQFIVTFEIDKNGILSVLAESKSTGKNNSIVISL